MAASLDEAMNEAREFLEDRVPEALSAVSASIAARVQEVCEGPVQQSAARLEEAYEKWEATLEAVEGLIIEQSFAAAPGHAREVVEYALGECRRGHEDGLRQLQEVAAAVAEALSGLKEEVSTRTATQRAEGQAELSDGHRELQQALGESGRALDTVKQLLASFTFVQL